ncbi:MULTISPECIES: VOC family protein [unclassified Kribbella]|uniref:VOC family protein n=1 Tax=unclassified Kribbella TaxID=2644121 RepID=UPI0033F24612
MLIFVTDLARSEHFYTSLLGLRLSDRIRGMATFLNSGPGDHHVFGFIQSTHRGLHHSSWEVTNFDQLAVGAGTMHDKGHEEGWGLGRHTLGSNLFHYIRDPWGGWIEYGADMDRITDAWKAGDRETPPAVWCPMPPETFLANLEEPGWRDKGRKRVTHCFRQTRRALSWSVSVRSYGGRGGEDSDTSRVGQRRVVPVREPVRRCGRCPGSLHRRG